LYDLPSSRAHSCKFVRGGPSSDRSTRLLLPFFSMLTDYFKMAISDVSTPKGSTTKSIPLRPARARKKQPPSQPSKGQSTLFAEPSNSTYLTPIAANIPPQSSRSSSAPQKAKSPSTSTKTPSSRLLRSSQQLSKAASPSPSAEPSVSPRRAQSSSPRSSTVSTTTPSQSRSSHARTRTFSRVTLLS
jgi:hypothetical protein